MSSFTLEQENYINLNVFQKLHEINEYLIETYNLDISNKIPTLPIWIKKNTIIYPNYIDKYEIDYNGEIYTYYIDNSDNVYKLEADLFIYVGSFNKKTNIINLI